MSGERRSDFCVTLADGARLGCTSFGNPAGRPLLFFHGWPGSRLQGDLASAAVRDQGWRMVAVDRPGIGLTVVPETFTFTGWARRIGELLDALRWERCHLFAISGGAPSALACAVAIPERFHAVGIACGAVSIAEAPSLDGLFPLFRSLLAVDRMLPQLSPAVLWAMKAYLAIVPPAASMQLNRLLLRGADARVFADPALRRSVALGLREAYRQGPLGVLRDGRSIAEPWGFNWRKAATNVPIQFWHGDGDGTIPLALAQWAAGEMDLRDRLEVLPGEGHFSLPIGRGPLLLEQLGQM